MDGSRARRRRRASACAAALLSGVLLSGTAVFGGAAHADTTTPVVNAGDVTASEGDAGIAVLHVPVELSQPGSVPVSVKWTLVGVTATAGSDFTAAHGVARFLPGITAKTVAVRIYGDTIVEPDETISIVLSSPVGATLGRNGTVTIRNDDSVAAARRMGPMVTTPELAIGSATVIEGNAGQHYLRLPITLSVPAPQRLVVGVSTQCGSAAGMTDYVPSSVKTLVFAPGTREKDLVFQTLTTRKANDVVSFVEHIELNAGSASVQVPSGAAVIVDNSGSSASASAAASAPASVGQIERASLASDGQQLYSNDGGQCNGGDQAMGSKLADMSDDGTKVLFYSDAANVVPGTTDGQIHVYLRDLAAGTTVRIDPANSPFAGFGGTQLSGDGRYSTYSLANDQRSLGVFRHDNVTGANTLGSPLPSGGVADAYRGSISDDGSELVFLNEGLNNTASLYAHDFTSGATSRVAGADDSWAGPVLSKDGRYVVFESSDALLPSDTNNYPDVYVADLTTGSLQRANLTSAGGQEAPNTIWPSLNPTSFAMSANDRYVAFTSWSPTFATNTSDILLRDLVTNTTIPVTTGLTGPAGKPWCRYNLPSLSSDGTKVAYAVHCTAGDGVARPDDLTGYYLTDMTTGVTTRIDTAPDGSPSNGDPAYTGEAPVIASDGSAIAFDSIGSNLVDNDTNGQFDVFLWHQS
jgi:Tol biopolymer transport system component